jgi:hypothetical protein
MDVNYPRNFMYDNAEVDVLEEANQISLDLKGRVVTKNFKS